VQSPLIPRGLASDYVLLIDNGKDVGGLDAFRVVDEYAFGTNRQFLMLTGGGADFLKGTDILQSFDLRREGPGLSGLLVRAVGAGFREVYFRLTRLSATVGQCRP
jgi:hypothetical protein